jgi:DNA polymerase-1
MPDTLRPQVAALDDLARAMGVPLHRAPGKEADDLLASLARRIAAPTLVVSGDTDLVQLVDARTTVLFIGRRQKEHVRYDPAAVEARYGFSAPCLPTFKAMVGDPSDALPGIPGIGPTTARKLCAAHGDADAILAANPRLSPHADALRRWEGLGRLETDLPLREPLFAPVDRAGLERWFERWEFASLVKRLRALA